MTKSKSTAVSLAGVIAAAVVSLGSGPGTVEDKPDPAKPLTNRTYCVADLGNGRVAAGTSYGVVFYQVPPKLEPGKDGFARLTPTAQGVGLPDSVNDLDYNGTLLFAAVGPTGIRILGKDEQGVFASEALIETPGAAMSVHGAGNLLFVGLGTMGFAAYDISSPTAPVQLLLQETDGYVRDLLVLPGLPGSGDSPPRDQHHVWVANGRGGLLHFHFDAKLQMVAAHTLDVAGDVRAVRAFGDKLVLSNGVGVCVTDATLDKAGLKCVEAGDVARGLAIGAETIFVADSGDGVLALALDQDTGLAASKRRTPGEGSVNKVAAFNDLLFLAADYYGLLVIPLDQF